jgi:hypothetical protein
MKKIHTFYYFDIKHHPLRYARKCFFYSKFFYNKLYSRKNFRYLINWNKKAGCISVLQKTLSFNHEYFYI